MSGFRPAFWPTVMTVPAVLAMIALGSWQVYRLDWKLNLIAQMEAQLAAAPVPLPAGPVDPETWDYRRVTVSGTFDHAKEVHMVSHSYRGNLGYHIYTPLNRDDGDGVVLVNRGWVPRDNKDPATRADGQVGGSVVVDGIVRKGWGQASFVPDNDPAKNVWFFADLPAIAKDHGYRPADRVRRGRPRAQSRRLSAWRPDTGDAAQQPSGLRDHLVRSRRGAGRDLHSLASKPTETSGRMNAYQDLESRFRRRALLGEAMAILHWDYATTMPSGAAEGRAEQLTALTLESQAILTEPDVAGLLDNAEASVDGADAWQAANLGRMRRAWQHANAVPPDLVAALTRAGSACEMVWREARQANDFQRLCPHLEKVVELTRESAMARADALDCSPYDALLDQYEPGGSTARIDTLFADLEGFLPGFLEKVLEAQASRPGPVMPDGPFPVDAQRDLGERLMRALGFDFDQGRLDVSHHPFHRRRGRRCQDHHALQRGGFHPVADGHAARNRPRALRDGPAAGLALSAGRRGRRYGVA